MGMTDTVYCDYPLPDPGQQDGHFETKDLDQRRHVFVITRDGRLLRRAFGALVHDVEWPIDGHLRMYATDPDRKHVEYHVRFMAGRVDAIERIEGDPAMETPESFPTGTPGPPSPDKWGRPLTADELFAFTPRRIELVDGRIPGDEKLALLLLTSLGLRRVAAMVGFDRWRSALPESDVWPADASDYDGRRTRKDREALEMRLLQQLRQRRDRLSELLASCSDHWGYEDPIYRFYHHSFKVYRLQEQTQTIVRELAALLPGQPLNLWFLQLLEQGTGKTFQPDDNSRWTEATRPIVEAFFHARYFLEMAVRHATLQSPPSPLPSGYAALLYLYGLR